MTDSYKRESVAVDSDSVPEVSLLAQWYIRHMLDPNLADIHEIEWQSLFDKLDTANKKEDTDG